MIVATSGGNGAVVVGGWDILMPHKKRLNKKRGRRGKWSPFTEEGKKNIRELQKMVLSGLTDEEIGEKFGVTARYITILRNRLKKKYGIDLDKRRKTLLHPPESRPRLTKGERTNLDDDLGTRTKKLFGGRSIDVPGILQLSDEELFFLREHPEEFARKCIVWNGSRLELDDYQIKWIKDKSKFKIANKSRRVGLSFATAFMAFHRAIFYPGSVELFVSIKEDRAKELMDYVYAFAGSNPDLFDGIFIERQRLYCHLTNGSRIYSLSNSPSGVRGIPQFKDVDVYIDEFAHFKTGQDERLYQALIASVSLGGTMSIWSTPFGRRGLFYKLWVESDPNHDKYNGYSRHEIPWWKCPRIDKKTIEAIKQATDPITFRQEFCCEFVSSGDELFTEDTILNAQENGILISAPQSSNPFYIGVDFAQKHDSTAIIVVEFDGDAYVVRHIEEIKGKGIEYVIPKIETLFNKFRPTGIYCDETGMGIPLTRELKNRLGSVVNGVTFTNQKKDAMIMNLWHLFNDGKIKIPPHEELKNQLLRMERLETPTGAPKYTGKFEGKKDDLVWALALACHSDNRRWSGVVSFGDVDVLDHLIDFA